MPFPFAAAAIGSLAKKYAPKLIGKATRAIFGKKPLTKGSQLLTRPLTRAAAVAAPTIGASYAASKVLPSKSVPSLPALRAPVTSYRRSDSSVQGRVPGLGPQGVQPDVENRQVRVCPPGYVLGEDGLCYSKKLLPKQFREHKPDPRPAVSSSDVKAIRKADRAKKRLVKLTKQAGAHASMSKPRRK